MSQKDSENEQILLSTGKVLTVPTSSNESPEHDDSDQPVVNRVKNVWGSSSGAGSDFLDKYRKERALEISRLEEMDKKWKEDMENKLFHSQRMYRIKKESDKTMKRKMKREKKKMKIASLKQGSQSTESDPNKTSKTDRSNQDSIDNDAVNDVKDNNKNYVFGVSDQISPESDLDKNKDSLDKKTNLIIVDQSENDF